MKKIIKKTFEKISKSSPVLSSSLLYFIKLRRIPNLQNPKNFTEKLTWLKIYEYAQSSKVSQLADKYSVRTYVQKKGHASILNELYGVYDSEIEINFNALPNSFALKGTHGCGYNIVVHNKNDVNLEDIRDTAKSWLSEIYGYASTELHYTAIKPRVIAEKNLADGPRGIPHEYKIFCFNGTPAVIQVSPDTQSEIKRNYFNKDWNELLYSKDGYRHEKPLKKPAELDSMLSIARDLAEGFPFVRVDLYAGDGTIIFGEITFTPAAGCPPILSETGIKEMGKLLDISGVIARNSWSQS